MLRNKNIEKLRDPNTEWDIIVIGGGATGLGTAVDAATRGYKVALLEQADFTKATSSRSTKLVHGGVRYLAQGDVSMVVEALRERGRMKENAPHLVKDQRFIIGNYKWWEKPFYTIGLTVYDVLAGKRSLGRSLPMSKQSVLKEIPQINTNKLRGGVVYYDGQFDDSRMGITLLKTALDNGAVAANYIKVTDLTKNAEGKLNGVVVHDELDKESFKMKAKTIINATGIFVDSIMQMDKPDKEHVVRPSQGVHLVVDKSFLGGDAALMVPKTSDGRVLFGVPWHDVVVLGTTDTPLDEFTLEPHALEEEIEFILKTAGEYLSKRPRREDVLSVFAGLRPLAAPKKSEDGQKTKEISRSHKQYLSSNGLISITGGKWTTYREMAEEVVDKAIQVGNLQEKACVTKDLKLRGYKKVVDRSNFNYVYGTDLDNIQALEKEDASLAELIHPKLQTTKSQVVWAVREEMAQTIEDVLSRRLRTLLLDARLAIDAAPAVASIMAKELNKDKEWEQNQVKEFTQLAQNYLLVKYKP